MALHPEFKPKTLDEAIDSCMGVGPISDIHERTYDCITYFLRDRFNNYLFKTESAETKEVLKALFQEIIARRYDDPK